jgi:hypothetical protein
MTPIFKYGFPSVVLLVVVALLLIDAWALAVLFGVVELYLLLLAIPLKRVELEDGFLVVSGFRRSYRVPISAIEQVQEKRMLSIRPVWILFSISTPCGDSISFIPESWVVPPWRPHPVLQLLRKAGSAARSLGPVV